MEKFITTFRYITNIIRFPFLAKKFNPGSLLETKKFSNVIVMVGAGISVNAGIPDFRSSEGLYSRISEEVFDLSAFCKNPKAFYSTIKEFFRPHEPTLTHHFLGLLCDKGCLRRIYTQNIDGLEEKAGIPADKIVYAHGSLKTTHCSNIYCRKKYDAEYVKQKILKDEVIVCDRCNYYVKPDVILYGEELSKTFMNCVEKDFPSCDLLVVIGTSLSVYPFCNLVDYVPPNTPMILINKENISVEKNWTRKILGDCDNAISKIAKEMNLWQDLQSRIRCKNGQ